ncbi:MAG: VOC family protein [Eubacteriales bacterium]|nr:VOC family protein [Eubacteriales bacterium]
MNRSMMQVFVKDSKEALEFYRQAFNAEILCKYPDENGNYMHSELNAYGQIIAVSEITEGVNPGNTMMFCFDFGSGHEKDIKTAYEVLKEEAITCSPLDKCDYSSLQFVCTDKFGVTWCLFI